MRIAILQLAYNIGDFTANNQKILTAYQEAVARGADLVITANPAGSTEVIGDMDATSAFVQADCQALTELSKNIGNIPLWIYSGDFACNIRLNLLKNSSYQEIADIDSLTTYFNDLQIGIYHLFPEEKGFYNETDDLTVYFSTRPIYPGESGNLTDVFRSFSQQAEHPFIFINALGGYDSTVFGGFALAADENGRIIAKSHGWHEETLLFDLFPSHPAKELDATNSRQILSTESIRDYIFNKSFAAGYVLAPEDTDRKEWQGEAVETLCFGLKEYMSKCGFKKVLVGLSGGIDSALVAALAVRAIGADNVHGITMPSRYSPDDSPNDAKQLATNLGIALDTIPIEPIFAQALNSLTPVLGNPPWGVAQENLQARIRGTLLMTYSNRHGHLVLATGNKSELSVGYATLYGDMCGGLELIGDVYKTDVYKLCRFLNEEAGRELIPVSTLTKPPSAELAPGQKDQDSLPPYPVLDAILRLFLEKHLSMTDIIAAGHDEAVVRRVLWLIKRAEYKRAQSAPVINISGHAFGCIRRYPIAQAFMG